MRGGGGGGVAPEDIGAPDTVINNYRGVEIEDNIVAPKYNLRPPEYQSIDTISRLS